MLDRLIHRGPRLGYRAIVEQVISCIASRTLLPGQKLPPQRDLAHQLGVAVGTVGRAYAELEQQGFVSSHVGRGTFIADRVSLINRTGAAGETSTIDMAIYRVPVPPGDHLEVVLRALASERRSDQLLGLGPVAGLAAHRAALAGWLQRYGVDASSEQIVITDGGQHATMVALSTLTHSGQIIATEKVTDPKVKAVASYLDRRLVGVAADQEGMVPDALDEVCRVHRVAAIYVTTRCHNPTNATLARERRETIAELARRYDLPIIESDIYGSLMEEADPPIHAFAPERTHFVTSLGRIAGPGMKVGCLVSPRADVARTQSGVGMSTGTATLIAAEIARRWIEGGRLEAMIDWQRAEILRRLSVLAGFPRLGQARTAPTSPHVWLELPDPWRAEDFVEAAAEHGVSIAPSHSFVVGRSSIPYAVRLVIGAPDRIDQLGLACGRLERLLGTMPRVNGKGA